MSCEQTTFNTYVATSGPKPATQVALESLAMGALPAAVMLLGSLMTILSPTPPPKVLAHALQHLAAGIMICAIAMELVPPMARAKGIYSIVALVLGFSLGVLVMIGLSIFLDEAEGSEADASELDELAVAEAEALLQGDLRDTDAGGGMRTVNSTDRLAEAPKSRVGQAYNNIQTDTIQTDTGEDGGGDRGGAHVRPQAFPWLFAFCVYVDSCMDGLLVGLAMVTGNSAGVFMAAAMAVEMGFLGLTFAAACSGQPFHKALPAVLAGPIILASGSALGGLIANALAANEPALVGCTAFGVAALLYMVCEELLVSAHEEDDHVWWVDIQVFVGFLLAMLMDKLIAA